MKARTVIGIWTKWMYSFLPVLATRTGFCPTLVDQDNTFSRCLIKSVWTKVLLLILTLYLKSKKKVTKFLKISFYQNLSQRVNFVGFFERLLLNVNFRIELLLLSFQAEKAEISWFWSWIIKYAKHFPVIIFLTFQAFVPYGSTHGDTVLSRFNDAERHIELKKAMPLFTKLSRFLYVSITFDIWYNSRKRNFCRSLNNFNSKSFIVNIGSEHQKRGTLMQIPMNYHQPFRVTSEIRLA